MRSFEATKLACRARARSALTRPRRRDAQRFCAATVTLDTKIVVCLGWAVSLFVLALVPLDVVVVRLARKRFTSTRPRTAPKRRVACACADRVCGARRRR